ncbi:MAG: hypothetical protein RI964_3197 [Pseudomonadota bacterium]|jgi:NADH:ubiquinone oxidoreductase subunit 5 (subunit L)/multisubunit Na+/H+ antiporter MnhA subunit
MFEWVLPLIPAMPLLAAGWIVLRLLFGIGTSADGERHTARAVTGAAAASLALVLVADGQFLLHGSEPRTVILGNWLSSGTYSAQISFMVDPLSLSMATLVGVILLLVSRFAVNYLHRERGFQRFFLVLALFTAAMQLIALAGSVMLTFIGWELAGVSSWMLIAYNGQSRTATANANRAFVTNRIGDTGLLLGMFMALKWLHSLEWSVITTPPPDLSSLMVGVMAMGFMLAALAKSAQFPFSAWITRAMEGPTPSSAVFYGSIMVHAGVYLLLRMHPLLEHIPTLNYLLWVCGGLTVLYGWLGGLVQTDIKTSLMFAVLAQVGLMLISIALGWYSFALLHLVLHALWRAYQFLYSPSFALFTQWQAAPPAPRWLQHRPRLYAAALQRFWLDALADWLLVKPTQALSQEAQVFDGQILDQLSGTPQVHGGVMSLAEMQAVQRGQLHLQTDIGVGTGILGKTMQWLAQQCEALEQHLVLQSNGGKAKVGWDWVGRYLDRAEHLLKQPRYLVLLVAVTLVVIF